MQQIQKINPGAALQIDEDGKVNIIFPPAAQEEEGSGVWAHVYLLDQLKDKQDTDKYLGESY